MEADLNAYLIDNLGLESGLNASVKGGTPRELMKQGSNKEDDKGRSLNHFHEPINNKGLELPVLGGISAINWSLNPIGQQEWSWNDAREYYFKALTSSTKAERDEYWGKTFRALGQVMHLLQDSANPSHVRDDPHPFDDGLHDYMERKSVGSYIGGGIFSPDPSMLEQVGATRSEPFSNLFDRNVYSGSNPQATLSADVGVTEYTNANFFSDDTIPGQGSIFNADITFPTVRELVPAPIPSPYLTLPRLGSAAFSGARAAKLTGNQAVAKFLISNSQLDLLGQLQLDDVIYDAQAQNLIPRAVGYSAAVLTYFFRGEIPIEDYGYCYQPSLDGPGIYTIFDEPMFVPDEFKDEDLRGYYDRPDGTRVFDYSIILEGQLSHGGPVILTHVYQGPLGPDGAREPKAVVGDTHKVTYFFEPCLK
ncbi:MAG TPA: hypothetical protein DD706_01500 [Nitrospiraceae bacterium]|nr:hypothetical protein [Nitrospiraceae bacterium]